MIKFKRFLKEFDNKSRNIGCIDAIVGSTVHVRGFGWIKFGKNIFSGNYSDGKRVSFLWAIWFLFYERFIKKI